MNAAVQGPQSGLVSFFGVLARGRSYLNTLYLLIAFPLGVIYFCFLSVGLSLGLGLLIVWIGLLFLAAVLLGSWVLSAFERQQAIWLLGARIGPMTEAAPGERTLWDRCKAFLGNPVTWKGMLFLFLKFPLGVFSFCLAIVSLSVSLALLLAPLYYRWAPLDFYFGIVDWYVDTLGEALICSVVGFFLLVLTLHALNGVAWLWRELAGLLLGRPEVSPPTPRRGPAAAR